MLAISQPSVSQQIRELERACGGSLIVSRGRTLAATPLGEELARIGRRILVHQHVAEKRIAEHLSGLAGRLTVGASMTTGVYLLPSLLALLRRERPSIDLQIEIHNTAEIAQLTADEVVDVGIVEGPVDRPELTVEPFVEDRLACIAHPEHRLARVARIELDALWEDTLLLREPGSGTREAFERALAPRGLDFARVMPVNNTEAIKSAVRSGIGIAWVSQLAIRDELAAGALVVLDVPSVRPRRMLSILRRNNRVHAPIVEAFIAMLTETPQAMTLDARNRSIAASS